MSDTAPGGPLAMEVACGYLADVLATEVRRERPVAVSRDLEEATRQLARAAYRANLPEAALVRWLGVAGASALGGGGVSVELTRQLNAWAAHEFAAAAGRANGRWAARVA